MSGTEVKGGRTVRYIGRLSKSSGSYFVAYIPREKNPEVEPLYGKELAITLVEIILGEDAKPRDGQTLQFIAPLSKSSGNYFVFYLPRNKSEEAAKLYGKDLSVLLTEIVIG